MASRLSWLKAKKGPFSNGAFLRGLNKEYKAEVSLVREERMQLVWCWRGDVEGLNLGVGWAGLLIAR